MTSNNRHIRSREANGRQLSYLEGWYAISEANRIFGFDGWSRETVETRCAVARENRGAFLAIYIARVAQLAAVPKANTTSAGADAVRPKPTLRTTWRDHRDVPWDIYKPFDSV